MLLNENTKFSSKNPKQEEHQSIAYRLMQQVYPDGMAADERERTDVRFVKPFRTAAVFEQASKANTREEDENPRKKREIIGAEETRARKTEPEEKRRGIEFTRKLNGKERGESDLSLRNAAEKPEQEKTGGDSGDRRDLLRELLQKRKQHHGNAQEMQDTECNERPRHNEVCGECQDQTESEADQTALDIRTGIMADSAGDQNK